MTQWPVPSVPSALVVQALPSESPSAEPTTDQTDPAIAQFWSDGRPVEDHEELDPGSFETVPLDECPQADPDSLQLETKGITSQVPKGKLLAGELWQRASLFKSSLAAKLREHGQGERANELDDCHSRTVYCQCKGCRTTQQFRNRCDRFYCPECQPKLARKRATGVEWWTKQISQPKHVVLTMRNIPELTRGHVQELKRYLTRLRNRKFCANWKGGLYSVECTNEGRGWHLHLHLLVDARWIDGGELARVWHSVTNGGGYIVKVKDCRRHDYLREVTKYAAKGSDLAAWNGREAIDFITAFDGVRCFGVFGSLYGKRTEWREWIKANTAFRQTCRCGCSSFRFFDQAEWDAEGCVGGSPARSRPPPEHSPEQRELAIMEGIAHLQAISR